MFMRIFGRAFRLMKIGRWLDWLWFNLARLRSPGVITADGLPYVEWPVRLQLGRGSSMHLGKNVKLMSGFRCWVSGNSHFDVGDDVLFNTQGWVSVERGVTIGADCIFGPRVVIVDADHRFDDVSVATWRQGSAGNPIEIGTNVWVGANSTVTRSVGDDCVVGANAVVTKAIPPRSVAVGVPARVVRSRDAN